MASVVFGALIGYERRSSDRPGGIRTMALTSLGIPPLNTVELQGLGKQTKPGQRLPSPRDGSVQEKCGPNYPLLPPHILYFTLRESKKKHLFHPIKRNCRELLIQVIVSQSINQQIALDFLLEMW